MLTGVAIRITVLTNGPLRVEGAPGELVLADASGKNFDLGGRTSIGLCRCGLSANKPFCDGAHAREGFQSLCEARALPAPPAKA